MRRTMLIVVMFTAAVWPQAKQPTAALEGYDPVLLSEGKEQPGRDGLSVQRGRFLYQFANPETKARFEREPDRYSIQFDGACARMGAPVAGNPDTYYVHEGRIYIFGSSDCYKKFAAAPERFLGPDSGLASGPRTQEARRLGEQLWQRVAAEMLGGQASVRSLVETRKMAAGGQESTTWQMSVLPGTHRSITRNGQFEYGNAVTPGGAIQVARGEGIRLPKSFEAAVRAGYGHDLLTLLMMRGSAGFQVYAVDEKVLEIKAEDVWSRIGVDAKKGLVEWLSYRSRGMEGGYEETRVKYLDYRETGGRRLPFKAEVSVGGKEMPMRGWTVVSYEFNAADIESRLEMPEKVKEY